MINISVVIPMYNSQETIIKCLDSVKNQSEFHFIKEIIIIDDGSTDDSEKIVNTYKIKNPNLPIILIKKENGGVSSARNLGIKLSNYNWIALLDSDDVWFPNKIKLQVRALEKHPEIKFLGSNRNNEHVKIGKEVYDDIYKMNIHCFLLKVWPSVPTVIFNKEIIDYVGYFDESKNHGEDGSFWLSILRYDSIYYLKESLVYTGNGKASFGESGLSANNKLMHKGCKNLIIDAYKNKDIGFFSFFIYLLYEQIKYIRRLIITRRRQLCKLKK